MTEPSTEQGVFHGPLPPPPPRRRSRSLRRAAPWLLAVALLFAVAVIGGLGGAYLVATLRAVPSPDAAFLPTPTPAATSEPTPAASVSPTAAPTATVQPTAQPTPSPTAEPTPSPTPIVYVVARGDTIGRIAARFGVTPQSVIELNALRNPNRIVPGQQLLIPVAGATPAP